MEQQIKVQVLIVGLGPAGGACGLGLAGRGVKTLAIDRAYFPRDKICGDALSHSAQSFLLKRELLNADSEHICHSHHRVHGSFMVQLFPFLRDQQQGWNLDGETIQSTSNSFLTIRRHQLDHALVRACATRKLPMRFGWQAMAMKLDPATNTWCISGLIRNRQGKAEGAFRINADVVVACDGVSSIIRRACLPKRNDRQLAIASRTYSPFASDRDQTTSSIDFRWPGTASYYWNFAVAGGFNSGVVSFPDISTQMTGKQLIEVTRELAPPGDATRTMAIPILSEADDVEPAAGVLLTGDAASLVDPYLGHGIDRALQSGDLAARVLREGLREKQAPSQMSRRYRAELAPQRRLWLKTGLGQQEMQVNGVEDLKERLLLKSFLSKLECV